MVLAAFRAPYEARSVGTTSRFGTIHRSRLQDHGHHRTHLRTCTGELPSRRRSAQNAHAHAIGINRETAQSTCRCRLVQLEQHQRLQRSRRPVESEACSVAGFVEVFVGWDVAAPKLAIKTSAPTSTAWRRARRFQRRGATIAGLSHPNIIPITTSAKAMARRFRCAPGSRGPRARRSARRRRGVPDSA